MKATKLVADQFASLRGALAYTTLTQAWIQVRLNSVARKLQKSPQKLIYPAMKCNGTVDIHSDSGYRRLTGE
eukprot:8618765-Lingulodinium_polyedra.AAC.1